MLLVVMLIGTAAVAHSAEPGAPTQNPATVRSIQNELGRLGYYKGPMNGQADATTKAAIGRYQHDKGLPVDGQPSSRLWSFMQSSSSPSNRGVATTREQARQHQNGTSCCR